VVRDRQLRGSPADPSTRPSRGSLTPRQRAHPAVPTDNLDGLIKSLPSRTTSEATAALVDFSHLGGSCPDLMVTADPDALHGAMAHQPDVAASFGDTIALALARLVSASVGARADDAVVGGVEPDSVEYLARVLVDYGLNYDNGRPLRVSPTKLGDLLGAGRRRLHESTDLAAVGAPRRDHAGPAARRGRARSDCAMTTEPPPESTFVRGNARLEHLPADPVRAAQVAAIRTRMGEDGARLAAEKLHGDDQAR
jgi:hypothetical protein